LKLKKHTQTPGCGEIEPTAEADEAFGVAVTLGRPPPAVRRRPNLDHDDGRFPWNITDIRQDDPRQAAKIAVMNSRSDE
jgi:hypothetical protein